MLERVKVNYLKVRDWDLSKESVLLFSGLITLAVMEQEMEEKEGHIYYKTGLNTLFQSIPHMKSTTEITKTLKFLESGGLMKTMLVDDVLYYMFTDKGCTWLVYDIKDAQCIKGLQNAK